MRLGEGATIDVAARRATLGSGEVVTGDALVIATGTRRKKLGVEGSR